MLTADACRRPDPAAIGPGMAPMASALVASLLASQIAVRRCGAVFERDRRREAVAERGRVGEHERAAGAVLREMTAVAAAVADRAADEVEVGLRLAEGEAGDLDERALGVEHAGRRVGRGLP